MTLILQKVVSEQATPSAGHKTVAISPPSKMVLKSSLVCRNGPCKQDNSPGEVDTMVMIKFGNNTKNNKKYGSAVTN